MPQYAAVLDLSSLDGNNGFQINGEEAGDRLGFSVSSAGDLNGDGFADLIVGASDADPHGAESGAAYVVFGKAAGFGATLNVSSLNGANGFQINGELAGDNAGFVVSSAGDVNGDGVDDIIVGAPFADAHGPATGQAYVVFGKLSGFGATLDLSSLNGSNGFQITGEASTEGNWTARNVSAGDINGDGYDDLIIGAFVAEPHGTMSGSTYVVFGKGTPFSSNLELSTLTGSNGFQINGKAAYDVAGYSVASAGDVNGDGFADLLIGAMSNIIAGATSAAYVVYGRATGFGPTLELSSLDGNNGFQINGESITDAAGCSVASAGDINADGFADFVVGAKMASPNGEYSGATYVVFGKATGFGATLDLSTLNGTNGFQINGEATYDQSGRSVSSAGDFNGDGFDDLIVGAFGADPHGVYSGASYVVFGKASGFTANFNLSALDGNNGFQISGEHAFYATGISVSSAGDISADGFADLIVGTDESVQGGTNVGAAYVIFGAMPGEAVTRTGTDIDNTIHGGNFDDALSGLDGGDTLYGHGGSDTLDGAKGKDKLIGGAGSDTLDGGGKADKFVYKAVSDSSSTSYDAVQRADFDEDTFGTSVTVTAIDSAISTGTLRTAHFDSDLSDAVAGLGVHHAVLFSPDAGGLAGKTFLIVDVNGAAGYQAGEDLVVELRNPQNLASLGVEDFV